MRIAVVLGVVDWCLSINRCWSHLERPVSVARFMDLTWLADDTALLTMKCIMMFGCALYLAGWWQVWKSERGAKSTKAIDCLTPIGLFLGLAGLVLGQANRNSIGSIHHGYLALGLVMLTQFVFHCIALKRVWRQNSATREDWAIYFSIQTICVSYLLAGWAKVSASGWQWIRDGHFVTVHMTRTQAETYHDKLLPETLDRLQPWIDWGLQYPGQIRLVLAGSLILELIAIFALLGPRWAAILGIMLVAMHEGIAIMMALFFPLNQLLVLAFMINPVRWVAGAWQRFRPARPQD